MTRAHELFERLRSRGEAALDELIADREPESLFLDFKRSPSDGANRNLASEDNKNLSRSISGFANSTGGVVVWGVDCRRDSSGSEVARKYPLVDAHGFNTKLQAAISRTTIPPQDGVEVLAFHEEGGAPRGFAAVLVPRSRMGPIRAVSTNHYHVRTGSDFSIVSHDVLAGMFGRHPAPDLQLNFLSHPARLDSRPGCLSIAVGLVLVNSSAVFAERPYLSASFGDFDPARLAIQTPDPANFSVRRGPLPAFSVIADQRFALAPGAAEHICDVIIEIATAQPGSVGLDCTVGAIGAPPNRFQLLASAAEVQAGIARAEAGPFPSLELLRLVHS